jgi:small subunit ribosomal protein S17
MNKIDEKNNRIVVGTAVGDALNKTVKVMIERRTAHPVYGKIMTLSANRLVHDESNVCKKGDKVSISSIRPKSKNKTWQLVEVLNSSKDI